MRRADRVLLLLGLLAGCDGAQSMMGADGVHGRDFTILFEIFLWVCGVFYLLVVAFLAAAVFRRRGKRQDGFVDDGRSRDGMLRTGLIGWVILVVSGLFGLTLASYLTDRSWGQARPAQALKIEVIANQWWWDVRYQDPIPANNLRTANELHLPVGMPVHIVLKSNDVIHSFWVPNLAGKQDLIPGRINDILLLPTKRGRFRGECAEFCGAQHAHMALDVTVESRAEFDAWRRRQLAPAPAPATPLTLAGYNYVTSRECSVCHNIAGTPASGQVAPDLTHLASRRSIAAGTMPMTRGHLYAWVADPQRVKPGNYMPYIGLEPEELHAVVAYLETLK